MLCHLHPDEDQWDLVDCELSAGTQRLVLTFEEFKSRLQSILYSDFNLLGRESKKWVL